MLCHYLLQTSLAQYWKDSFRPWFLLWGKKWDLSAWPTDYSPGQPGNFFGAASYRVDPRTGLLGQLGAKEKGKSLSTAGATLQDLEYVQK